MKQKSVKKSPLLRIRPFQPRPIWRDVCDAIRIAHPQIAFFASDSKTHELDLK